MESKKKKLLKATENLNIALKQYRRENSELNFLTLSKCFEVLMEYAWRELKLAVEDQGLEAPSPKQAIKEGAKLKLIQQPETWLECLEARNNSVHDYFGITPEEFSELAEELLGLMQKSKINQP